jgi:hypothetical protein
MSATVTINGYTISIDPSFFSEIEGINSGGVSQRSDIVINYLSFGNGTYTESVLEVDLGASDGSIPASITTPFSYNVSAENGNAVGNITLALYGSAGDENAVFRATVQTLTVATTPLPSAWSMLIGGICAVGWLACRKQKNAAATAAGQ